MNKDNSSQLTPTLPAHYQLLSHPLVHEPCSPSHIGCMDILYNSTYLLDLIGSIDVDSQGEGERCAFVQAMSDSDDAYKQALFNGLAVCLGVSREDINKFIGLIE